MTPAEFEWTSAETKERREAELLAAANVVVVVIEALHNAGFFSVSMSDNSRIDAAIKAYKTLQP